MFREFLDTIDKKGELLHVKKEADPRFEIGTVIYKADERPILFENVKGYPHAKILAGLCSSRDTLAGSIGVTKEQMIHAVSKAMDKQGELNIVNDAPFLKNRIPNPNLVEHLPIMTFYENGEKQYTSACMVLCKSAGGQNLSFHRMMYLGGSKFAIRIIPQRHLDMNYQKTVVGEKKEMKVAVVCGVHPALEIAGATSYSPEFDELKFAATLMGKPLDVVELDSFLVPAHAEVVMIGRITTQTADEGPFVDLTGTYDIIRKQPVIEIDTLYFRDDFIWRTLIPGMREHRHLMGIPQEPRMLKIISNTLPSVKNVCLTWGGCSWLHAIVQIKKKTDGDGKNVIMAALAAHPSLKQVIVVDEDVDLFDPNDVEWAVATRCQPSRNTVIITGAKGSSLDKSSDLKAGTTDKWGIDATRPLGKAPEEFDKAKLPKQDALKVEDYL